MKGHRGIERRVRALVPARIRIPSIVLAELLLGAEKSDRREKSLQVVERLLQPFEPLSFDEAAAREYSRIRADLERQGQPIGPNDLILAATVMASGGRIVTNNTREFRRVKGLRVEDWSRGGR